MKTTAYIRNPNTGEYILDDDNNHHSIHILEALELRDNPKAYRENAYKNIEYMTRNPNPDMRVKLIPHQTKTPHFKFATDVSSTGDRTYDETYSHEAAVDIISSMEKMSINANGKIFNFEFTKVYREPYLILPNGKKFYPDILCLFDEKKHPIEYEKWGGKIAIEVTNKHECENEKKLEFELCNIPIFEFKITDSRKYPPERDRNRSDSITERVRHKSRLQSWLLNGIGMDLIIDPVSTHQHELICQKLSLKIFKLEEKQDYIKQQSKNLETKNSELEKREENLILSKNNILEKNKKLENKISELEEKFINEKDRVNSNEKFTQKIKKLHKAKLRMRNLVIATLLTTILAMQAEKIIVFVRNIL